MSAVSRSIPGPRPATGIALESPPRPVFCDLCSEQMGAHEISPVAFAITGANTCQFCIEELVYQ